MMDLPYKGEEALVMCIDIGTSELVLLLTRERY